MTDWVNCTGTQVSETRKLPWSTESTRNPAQAISTKNTSTVTSPTSTAIMRPRGGISSSTVSKPICRRFSAASAEP